MENFWSNHTCDPFTPRATPCTQGNLISYAANVSTPAHIAAVVKFASRHNVRLVVRNTAHDFNGRSTGAGALAVWTHYLKQAEPVTYSDTFYTGPAMRLGAGIQGFEAVAAAGAVGQVVVGGLCPTVGLAGGYTQGGGHSHLSTKFGMAADQTLEFEVVTAAGDVVKASRAQNEDLYWALSGGGGGTYAIVTAVTVRSHPDAPIGGGVVVVDGSILPAGKLAAAIDALYALVPAMVDGGLTTTAVHNATFLALTPLTLYNSTAEATQRLVSPWTSRLTELGVPFFETYTTLPNFGTHWSAYYPLSNPVGTFWQYGGRLVPRALLKSDAARTKLVETMVAQTDPAEGAGDNLFGVTVLSGASRTGAPNAVLPAWRDAALLVNGLISWDASAAGWDAMRAKMRRGTEEWGPQLDAAVPGSGNYANEGDAFRPDWQEAFFGANYPRLLAVKTKWDPEGVLYGRNNVGSEMWHVGEDGRMCRA
jgi:hypothetical protein